MKKEINKIVATIGFIVVVVGSIICGLESGMFELSTVYIAALLGTMFIFSTNGTLKNVGYGLNALAGSCGVAAITVTESAGVMVVSVGMILLLFASVLYFIMIALAFFGFAKEKRGESCKGDISNVLTKYKALQEEKVISEEEFAELKRRTLEVSEKTSVSIEDLKKWKKLLDQQIIDDTEFAKMKAKVFEK